MWKQLQEELAKPRINRRRIVKIFVGTVNQGAIDTGANLIAQRDPQLAEQLRRKKLR